MKKREASTHIRSVYGMIELRGYITDEPNGNSNGQPVLVIEEVVGELPLCFNRLLGKYAPEDIFEAVLRPEMAPNVNQTYPQPVNFSPVHLRKPPTDFHSSRNFQLYIASAKLIIFSLAKILHVVPNSKPSTNPNS